MNIRIVFFLTIASLAPVQAAETTGVLNVAPTLIELGDGWTTNLVACVLDPQSTPSEFDNFNGERSRLLEFYREQMKKDGRTGYATLLYTRSDAVTNRALYRVYIQRWQNTRLLHNRWVEWKMAPARIVRSGPMIGEDYFWSDDGVFQEFSFRRGLFNVVIQAGSASEYKPMVWLAVAIDAKIRGRPIPKTDAPREMINESLPQKN